MYKAAPAIFGPKLNQKGAAYTRVFTVFNIKASKLKQCNPHLTDLHSYKRLLIWNKSIKRNETTIIL